MYDATAHRTTERQRNIHNRQLARQLIKWAFENLTFYDELGVRVASQDAEKLIAHRYLANQARALVWCKSTVYYKCLVRPTSPKNCTPSRVKKAVEDLMTNGAYRDEYVDIKSENIDTFAWTGPKYTIAILAHFTPCKSLTFYLHFSAAHEML